jgi:hypothetical protein
MLCRAGRPAQALEAVGDDDRPYALLVRALAEHAAGQDDAARQSLGRAVRWLDASSPWDPTQTNGAWLPWDQRVEIKVLQAEARAVLRRPGP